MAASMALGAGVASGADAYSGGLAVVVTRSITHAPARPATNPPMCAPCATPPPPCPAVKINGTMLSHTR